MRRRPRPDRGCGRRRRAGRDSRRVARHASSRARAAHDAARSAALAERVPERARPSMGERIELVLAEADQRAFQERGERQVVLGQEHHPAERHQVHDGDVLGQRQAVGAGDRDAVRLERAIDGVGQRAARPRENEDAAGADRLAGRFERLLADRSQPAIVLAMRLASRTSGLCSPRWSSGVVQSSGSGFAAGSIIGQTVTRPGSLRRAALWTGATPASAVSAACAGAAAEDRVDRREHHRHRAEGEVELRVRPGRPARAARGRRARAACARTRPARRPGRRRSTASRRRRQRACAPCSAAPSPAKNSSASALTTCHWRGLVSCASSTRMWSRPRSSL